MKLRDSAASKRRILDAAESEFAAKGFDGARLGNIARAAGVQQALIHHYFADKERLHADVIDRALAAIGAEGLDILARMATPLKPTKIPALVQALVDALVRFCTEHAAVLAMLRHDAAGAPPERRRLGTELVRDKIRPVFDAVVAAIDDMRRRGKVAEDVDARHLCISALAMASVTSQEAHLVRALWPEARLESPRFVEARKREIVATVLGRLLR